MDILQQIHSEAFSDDLKSMNVDLQGWIDYQGFMDFFKSNVTKQAKELGSLLIIEVGSWKGLSACTMAKFIKEEQIDAKIIAIDTWLGSPEHMRMQELTTRRLGVPRLYEQFLSNVYQMGYHDVIYPFPISSVQGGHFLEENKIVADVIYLDAGHEYEAIKLDMQIFWRILRPGGMMIMDDYKWEGVKKAIEEFAKCNKVDFDVNGNVAKIIKPLITSSLRASPKNLL